MKKQTFFTNFEISYLKKNHGKKNLGAKNRFMTKWFTIGVKTIKSWSIPPIPKQTNSELPRVLGEHFIYREIKIIYHYYHL
jgi:hypothetical protein